MKLDRAVNSKQLAAETRSMPHILMHQMRALSGFLFEAALLRNSNVCSEFLLGLLTLIALFIRCSKFSWCLMVLCFFLCFWWFFMDPEVGATGREVGATGREVGATGRDAKIPPLPMLIA